MKIYWNVLYNITNSNFFFKKSKNLIKFINILKKNKLHFIEKEYVLFYELDINTIYGLNNNIHKSKSFIKYFNNFFLNYIIFYNINFKFSLFYKYIYVFYFLKKYNKFFKYKNNLWKNLHNFKLFTFYHKTKKLRLIVKKNLKILVNFSSGMATKKLGIEEKKNKKSLKVFNIMIKSLFKNLKPHNTLFRCILQFKGSNSYLYKYLETLNKINLLFKDVYLIYTPSIPNKNNFKKIRSLKKNFRKGYLMHK